MKQVVFRVIASVTAVVAVVAGAGSRTGQAQTTSAQPARAGLEAQASETIARYCAACHSPSRRTAGLVLDPAGVSSVGAHAEQWEKVVSKLRSGSMPPPNARRPDRQTYDAVAGYLESELDRAASASPNVGHVPVLHRLTRTEYQNAVRDLLGVDVLPREMDWSYLLPPDNSTSGFDNVADLLFISPTALESYLNAAEKIAAMAVGDPSLPVMVNTYRVPDEQAQSARVEGLPIGTRGGGAIRTLFPLEGEYVFKVSLVSARGGGGGPAGAAVTPYQLELTVDGARAEVATVVGGGGRGGGAGRGGGPGAVAPGAIAAGATGPAGNDARAANSDPEFRVTLSAGPHLVGVTFVEPNEARDEETLRPRMRGTGPELGVEYVTISGPYNAKGTGDTPSRRRIFVCQPAGVRQEETCARQILSRIARRAYRRPVTGADLRELMSFYTRGRAEGTFDLGVQRAIQRLLVSPQFLFRIERSPAGAAPGSIHPVSDLELASRLSFFLWSSIPDDTLLELAIAGKLHQGRTLEDQVKRMLADPRSASLVTNFAEQWLFLRDLMSKKPNEILFPDFDETLREAFYRETTLFVDSVLRGDRSVLDLISSDYTFLNERLARHYGIPNVRGSDFRRVTLAPDSPRGGLLGHGSILSITSYANRTSPVNRGKWVLENLLSSPPPPPPADVPALITERKETGKAMTLRDAMIVHRENPACVGCHSRMDPIGFALENFDAVGRWRDRDAGEPIDASGVFPSGVAFNGTKELKAVLLAHPQEFVGTLTRKLLMYALGRNVQYFDEPTVRAVVRGAATSNYTFSSLVLGVVKSQGFQMREAQGPAKP